MADRVTTGAGVLSDLSFYAPVGHICLELGGEAEAILLASFEVPTRQIHTRWNHNRFKICNTSDRLLGTFKNTWILEVSKVIPTLNEQA
jgi:hypothetical protein